MRRMVRRSRLAAEALGALLVADARVRIRSRRRAARLLGMVASGPAMAPDEAITAEALRVARAVARRKAASNATGPPSIFASLPILTYQRGRPVSPHMARRSSFAAS